MRICDMYECLHMCLCLNSRTLTYFDDGHRDERNVCLYTNNLILIALDTYIYTYKHIYVNSWYTETFQQLYHVYPRWCTKILVYVYIPIWFLCTSTYLKV